MFRDNVTVVTKLYVVKLGKKTNRIANIRLSKDTKITLGMLPVDMRIILIRWEPNDISWYTDDVLGCWDVGGTSHHFVLWFMCSQGEGGDDKPVRQ